MSQSRCSICSRDFLKNDELKTTKCDHIFHCQCLNFWVDRMKKCPKCEESLTKQDIFSTTLGLPEGSESSDECDDVLLQTQDEIINVLAELRESKRRKSRSTRRRRRSSQMVEERRPRIENQDGTVVDCDVFRPLQVNFCLQTPMSFLGSMNRNQLK